jgi:hypothetical protein
MLLKLDMHFQRYKSFNKLNKALYKLSEKWHLIFLTGKSTQ